MALSAPVMFSDLGEVFGGSAFAVVVARGLEPAECVFNRGVFVMDVRRWKKLQITREIERWMARYREAKKDPGREKGSRAEFFKSWTRNSGIHEVRIRFRFLETHGARRRS